MSKHTAAKAIMSFLINVADTGLGLFRSSLRCDLNSRKALRGFF